MSLRYLIAPALLVALASVTGCATETNEQTDQSEDQFSLGDLLHGGGGFDFGGGSSHTVGQAVAGPNGVFTTMVHANGSGCPSGSWTAGISPDGQTFTITFNQYEAKVSAGQSRDIKDCTIDVALVGTQNLTFAIGTFYYQGYAFLEDSGMQAIQSADYSFNPVGLVADYIPGQAGQIFGAIAGAIPGGVHSQNVINGPADNSFTYEDNVGMGHWSDCGPATNLRIGTKLQLQNSPSRRNQGYLNDVTVDGKLSFGWKLSYKTCTPRHH